MVLRVAFYTLSSCMGCTLTVTIHLNELVEILGEDNVSVEYCKCFREDTMGEYIPLTDIAFVEGVVVTELDEEKLKNIRGRTRYLVALGTCAITGNTAYYAVEELRERGIHVNVKTVPEVVHVDYEIKGCPIPFSEVVDLLVRLCMGWTMIRQPDYTVCRECRLNSTLCLLDLGEPCLGPITMGGCRAPCPSNGVPCLGCRGLAQEAQIESYIKTLREKNIPIRIVIDRMKLVMGKHVESIVRRLEEEYS